MSDIAGLFSTSVDLSIVIGEKEVERTCGHCTNPFVMDIDFYLIDSNNNLPVCTSCATSIHPPLVDMLSMWSMRSGKPLNDDEKLYFNERALPIAKASFARCMKSDMIDVFYESLLKVPAISSIFNQHEYNIDELKKKVVDTLVFLLAHAAEPNLLRPRLEKVAAMHSRSDRRVHPMLYRHFIVVMLQSVAQCDPEFNEEVKRAWLHILPVPVRYLIRRY